MAYSKTTWVNGGLPAINAENLNNIENGIETLETEKAALDTSVSFTEIAINNGAWCNLTMTSTSTLFDASVYLNNSVDGSSWRIHNDSSFGNKLYISHNSANTFWIDTNGDITNTAYTELGELSPKIKVKTLTGTTAATSSTAVVVAHGLTGANIISYTVEVENGTNQSVPPQFTGAANFLYSCYKTTTGFSVKNEATSSNIYSKPIKIYVTYI